MEIEAEPAPWQITTSKDSFEIKVGDVVILIKKTMRPSQPPGSEKITTGGREYGWIKRTDSGAEVYFEPPLDLKNEGVFGLFNNFLLSKVLDDISKKVEDENKKNNTQYLFKYRTIIEDGRLLGISIAADKEALPDARYKRLKSAIAWTAAKAAQKA